jgi:hypothetical protein
MNPMIWLQKRGVYHPAVVSVFGTDDSSHPQIPWQDQDQDQETQEQGETI